MDAVTLTAASRTNLGKGAARSLRREGRIPAVIYGHGRDPLALDVDGRAIDRLLETIGGETVLIDVAIDGAAPVQAIVREVQRNPVRRSDVIHLDLYAVVAGEPIVVDVPVHLVGTAEGVRNQGGVVDHHLHRVSIKCLPTHIPEHVEVDITALKVGDAIHAGDLKIPNAEVQQEKDVAIVSILTTRAEASTEAGDASAAASPEVIKKGKADDAEASTES